MHKIIKNALFLKKKGKIAAESWGRRPQFPVGLRRKGPGLPSEPRIVTPITCYSYFSVRVYNANLINNRILKASSS